ncbi:uncharacterized protein LOC118808657 [Colossoma macropomum]|uniref:uncharacterized protein LOC118808657 n=1 Tax=Colossoma macropomum TaxID=42526 RepID=UPI00186455D3|nr:uncharacterized protein LOC118808657 [Colossoma macropomum]
MNRAIVLDALSALTCATVKDRAQPGSPGLDLSELTVQNFVSSALLPLILSKDEPSRAEPETEPDERTELFVDINNFLAPSFDYDFRNLNDSSECTRGGEPYTRPCGWYRFALKVVNKYPDGNAWLGPGGWRNESAAGEWPVSYHATGRPSEGNQRAEFGIFSTPNIVAAQQDEQMVKEFEKDGQRYRVMMQNRINPAERVRLNDDLWLVKVPLDLYALEEERRREELKKLLDRSIRPYGILIRQID